MKIHIIQKFDLIKNLNTITTVQQRQTKLNLVSLLCSSGCSEDEAGADAEVGGCADNAVVSNGMKHHHNHHQQQQQQPVEGVSEESNSNNTITSSDITVAGNKSERCPQCGIVCRNSRILQLHLEDQHKPLGAAYAIDKHHDLQAQFSQVVSYMPVYYVHAYFLGPALTILPPYTQCAG